MRTIILPISLFLSSAIASHVPSNQETHGNLSHAYAPAYSFDTRDGWETVPISDLDYKYVRNTAMGDASSTPDASHSLERRSRKHKGQGSSISGTIKNVVDATLKGIGKIEQVTITWYTGKDLKNPSCWHQSVWAPSDNSFACAVTLEGWINRPKCFTFLELCNGSKKCIFVRVVDTCAGCAKGSKHVDLTKAAFQALATLDQGTLQVQMRLATAPKEWNVALWGPKHA